MSPDYVAFRSFVLAHESALRDLMLERSTQTNEPGRCAVMLPVLSALRQPIALLEAGAAAGLCLLPDRYRYEYGGHRVGPPNAAVALSCEARGPVALPQAVPEVVWRRGIDLNPLDPADPDTTAWLTALVWAGQTKREDRLRAALAVAASDPPQVIRGDVRDGLGQLARSAPSGTTLVAFHSAVMPYPPEEDRAEVVAMISRLGAVWVSFEARGVLPQNRCPYGYTTDPVSSDMHPEDHELLVAMATAMAERSRYGVAQSSSGNINVGTRWTGCTRPTGP